MTDQKLRKFMAVEIVITQNTFWKEGSNYFMKTLYFVEDKWLSMTEVESSEGKEFEFLKSYFKSITINT